MQATGTGVVNGIDTDRIRGVIAEIGADPARAAADFRVRTAWRGGTRSDSKVTGFALGGEAIARNVRFACDEPCALLGSDAGPNPQELLMGALNACLVVGWVTSAAMRGIRIDALEIESDGRLDLRGFLGIDPQVAPGYESIRYRVRVRGDAPAAVFEEIHEAVRRTSPNHFILGRPIVLEGELVVG